MASAVVKEHAEVLQKAADKTADAAPKTPSALVTFFKSVFLPILPALVKALLDQVKSPKTNQILIQVRDTLVNADLGD